MKMVVDIDDGCDLMKLIHTLKDDVDGLFGVWRALADETAEGFEGALASARDGEPTLYY